MPCTEARSIRPPHGKRRQASTPACRFPSLSNAARTNSAPLRLGHVPSGSHKHVPQTTVLILRNSVWSPLLQGIGRLTPIDAAHSRGDWKKSTMLIEEHRSQYCALQRSRLRSPEGQIACAQRTEYWKDIQASTRRSCCCEPFFTNRTLHLREIIMRSERSEFRKRPRPDLEQLQAFRVQAVEARPYRLAIRTSILDGLSFLSLFLV